MSDYRTEPAPPADLCDQLRAAADRLLAGTPLRSDGKLTIKSLAEEAGIKRWILVNKYPLQLKNKYEAEFRQAGKKAASVRKADERADQLIRQLREARAEITHLEAVNRAYALIIDQLSAERYQADLLREPPPRRGHLAWCGDVIPRFPPPHELMEPDTRRRGRHGGSV